MDSGFRRNDGYESKRVSIAAALKMREARARKQNARRDGRA